MVNITLLAVLAIFLFSLISKNQEPSDNLNSKTHWSKDLIDACVNVDFTAFFLEFNSSLPILVIIFLTGIAIYWIRKRIQYRKLTYCFLRYCKYAARYFKCKDEGKEISQEKKPTPIKTILFLLALSIATTLLMLNLITLREIASQNSEIIKHTLSVTAENVIIPENPKKINDESFKVNILSSIICYAAIFGFVSILCGSALLVFNRNSKSLVAFLQTLFGGVLVTTGILANSAIIKAGFSNTFKFNTELNFVDNHPSIPPEKAPQSNFSEFGPKKLITIQGFESGKASISSAMESEINNACTTWKSYSSLNQKGVLLIIGSTDRTPLSASIKKIYESNSGLAKARAERVRETLEKCGMPTEKMITLDSGPNRTPSTQDYKNKNNFPEDRSVTVWAFWNIPRNINQDLINNNISGQ